MTFKSDETLSLVTAKYADLILEDITKALRWQTFWIIECAPPLRRAA